MDRVSGGRRQDYTCSQSGQHFGAVEVHDPIGVCAVLFREFSFCPFGYEIGQYLRLNDSSWLICYVEREELDGPLSNSARRVAVVYNVIKRYFGGYYYRTLLKVVS